MRAALFSGSIEPKDGYGNIAYELCTRLAKNGFQFTLFLPKSAQQYCSSANLPFETRCVLPEYVFRIYQPEGFKYFRGIDLKGFDLVHSIFDFPYCFAAWMSARKNTLPFMMGAQGTHGVRPLTYFPERWLLKWCYKNAKKIVVPSTFTRDKIWEHAGVQYPIDIIHNGVNFERFQKQVDASQLKEKYKDRTVLLTVGGLWGRKGHDLVLKALPQVIKEQPNVLYTIVGDGNGRPELEKLTDELGLRNHVEFCGRKSGDELVAHFQVSDVYVHTPKVADLKFEGFGIVYLEASACGKPIVATDAGGIRDAVLEGKTGLIAPDGDVAGIAERILTLCKDPALRQQLGASGKEYARQNDWLLIAAQFQNLYEGVVSRKKLTIEN